MPFLPRKRWPSVRFPACTPANDAGMTRPSSSATIHRTGRINRGPRAPVQTIERGQDISEITCGSTPARTCPAGLPFTSCLATRYSPLGVFTISSFETGTPCFSAKLMAALVGSPAASNAMDFGGPAISRVSSSCFKRILRAMATSLRGAPKVSIDSSIVGSPSKLFADRYFISIALSSSTALGIIPAGISSQPISKRRSPRDFAACGFMT